MSLGKYDTKLAAQCTLTTGQSTQKLEKDIDIVRTVRVQAHAIYNLEASKEEESTADDESWQEGKLKDKDIWQADEC